MTALGWLGGLLVFALPIGALVAVRRRRGLEPVWYAVAFIGGLAGVAAMVLQDVSFRVFAALIDIPPGTDRNTLFASPAALVFFPLAAGGIVEVVKSYAPRLFQTQLTRTQWAWSGLVVGLGAGLSDAIVVVGGSLWAGLGAEGQGGSGALLWLEAQTLARVWLHAAAGGLAMYWVASDRRGLGIALAVAAHAGALFVTQLLQYRAGIDAPWLGTIVSLGFAGAASLGLWGLGRRLGWPM